MRGKMVTQQQKETEPLHRFVSDAVMSKINPIEWGSMGFGIYNRLKAATNNDIVLEHLTRKNQYYESLEMRQRYMFIDVKTTFAHHYKDNPAYRKMCEAVRVEPSDLKTFDDLAKIPMLPARFFKDNTILSVPEDKIIIRSYLYQRIR
jgi:hypothetical protein